ncbi:Zinc finger CCCH domain-containing protein 14 [Habropoda laboriosa]|uniref:Zinc finger CCCH domain-containing protein 14 n=1 Tax=Habropoda laboriosa TaxID=597456 RepID=A0A0L7QSY8_9HYME|nr:PREDICTED: zinc finger CCCH domain-containing protein 14 [Habropoda laboriosa]KOC61586.1 Zinc finger CCCH domain-containing protein 14 [Habropoda laboriosa]
MDIRGIEVTNQLRSAIRAKLLELGIRYDEELPDYILVMVVNKKSRQQMHEDLYLFLENCTTPFVDWLHDQVLKKLQKVTVAKKKSLREFVPTVVVKQEEERKKRKTSTTSFLEDQLATQTVEKSSNKNVKDDKSFHKQNTKMSISSQKLDTSQNKSVDKSVKGTNHENKSDGTSTVTVVSQQSVSKRIQITDSQNVNINKEVPSFETPNNKSGDSHSDTKVDVSSSRNLKRPLDTANNYRENSEKKQNEAKRSKIEEDAESTTEDNTKKLKSCVNKPKVTSVVSIKNRLGVVSPRKKFEVHREKADTESRYRQNEKRLEKHRMDNNRNNNFQRGRNFDTEDRTKRTREIEPKYNESDKISSIRTRLGSFKIEKAAKSVELREKVNSNLKSKSAEKTTGTIKDRLGIASTNKSPKQLGSKESVEFKSKPLEQDRDTLSNNKNIKNRLGPLKNNFKPVSMKSGFNSSVRRSQSSEDEDYLTLGAEEELDDDAQSLGNSGPIKSHIIAINKPAPVKTERKRPRSLEKVNKECSDPEEKVEETKIPSKVIVTPRPLKPLQPTQKRATQSLLLRAVAEANQSVVTQKNPEPSLLDKKQTLKHLKPAAVRDVGQNLSVHLNSNKRLVMEKIQVELNTDVSESKSKSYVPQPVTEEHMGVVMSLFQRSDDNQKFLVTLNGYNNNLMKEKTTSDDDERLEMEVNEDDELALSTIQNDIYIQNESETSVFQIDMETEGDISVKERAEENNENCNTENVDKTEEIPKKRRKLSPIIYNRSHSPNPADLKASTLLTSPLLTKRLEKKPLTENTVTVIDKSKEKCRYWPNCTLGNKCAYLHPLVMCSAFPACKFGDKCAYRHPKCKFGLSCTKLGCVFSHPAKQCKYHPFCTKPACPYAHPMPVAVETTSQRAKFTWRRRD